MSSPRDARDITLAKIPSFGRVWHAARVFAMGVLALTAFAAHAAAISGTCGTGPAGAASTNARTLQTLKTNLFGHDEIGWSFYAPLMAREIETTCRPTDAGFARALGTWQQKKGLRPSGAVDAATLLRMKFVWQARRPFVLARRRGVCPDAPSEGALAKAMAEESYGKAIEVLPETLAAYRRMLGAARDQGIVAPASPVMRIFSGYRSPTYDQARCAAQHNCDGVRRATCSNHRTGLALDMYLGSAPGFEPDSTAAKNRAFISRTAAYLWLLDNAGKFGFANYPFEPWHWEYIGKAQ